VASTDGDIRVSASDLSHTRRLHGKGWDRAPGWSPHDRQIVFVSDRSGSDQIYLMGADGRRRTRLTSRGTNEDPASSPDGRLIAFDSDRTGRTHLF
jgi:TolB protein